MLVRRLISTGMVALWLVFLFLLSVPFREEFSHFYHHLIPSSMELPLLTKAYSLRILGTGNYLSANTDRFFYLFWGVVWAPPFAILYFTWKAREPALLTEFLLYSWMTYLLLCNFLLFIALYGLFLPFSH